MTLEARIHELCAAEPWLAAWFRLGEVIVQTPERSWATRKAYTDECPADLQAIGCTGLNARGLHDWVGWDLDVGHGRPEKQYGATFVAIQAGKMIRARAGPSTEVRLSKSGKGVHVRHVLADPLPPTETASFARAIVHELGIKADATALSRQAFWLWCGSRVQDSFKLIEAADFS